MVEDHALDGALADLAGATVTSQMTATTPPDTPFSPVPPRPSIDVTTSTGLGQGLYQYFVGAYGYTFAASFENAGTITDKSSNSFGYGFSTDDNSSGSFQLVNDATGKIYVEDTSGGAQAVGFNDVNNAMATFTNAGLVQVVADAASAIGDDNSTSGQGFTNAATGSLVVWGAVSAKGLYFPNGAPVINDGLIQVMGPNAIGVYGASTLVNTGTISATNTSGPLGTAVTIGSIGLDIVPNLAASFNNSGTIQADYALYVDTRSGVPSGSANFKVTNSGYIIGAIDPSGADFTLDNTGAVTGAINLTYGSDVIDDRGGELSGVISIAPNGQLDPNAHTLIPVSDTIYAGSGATQIDIHGSATPLTLAVTGSAQGDTTLQFDIASTAATVAQNADGSWTVNAGADGAETLTDVRTLQFTDRTVDLFSARAGAHDYAGDAKGDFLIENTQGQIVLGEVGANSQAGFTQVSWIDPAWAFHGSGDFLGDGRDQFLIENANGAVVVGDVQNGQAHFTQISGIGPNWSFVGTGDFLDHGKSDFLIENTVGQIVVGEVGSSGQAGFTQVAWIGTEWKFEGTGDFLGEGHDQFLIENGAGAVVVGDVVNGQASFTQVAGVGSEWSFVGAGDYLGDGKTDFLIENTQGQIVACEVGANHQTSYSQVAWIGTEWKFVGSADYLGEGHAQFLIENPNGALVVGDVVGGQAHFTQVSGIGSQWSFHM